MAIEIQPEQRHGPGGREPAHARRSRPWWMRPGFHTGLVGAVIGYIVGHFLGNAIGHTFDPLTLNDSSDMSITFGYVFLVVGWLAGLGVFNDLLRQMAAGRSRLRTRRARPTRGWPGTSGSRWTTRWSASSTWSP